MPLAVLCLQLALHWSSCFKYEKFLRNKLPKCLPLLVFPLCSFAAVLQLPKSSSEICSCPDPQQGRSWSLGSCNIFSRAGRCRLKKRKAARLCDYFVWITSALGFNITFHWFLCGIKPQRAVYRRGGKKQLCSQVSVRVSLILWVTAFPSELPVVKELLVKQGSSPDAAACLLHAVFPPAFAFTLSTLKKKRTMAVLYFPHKAVLHS